MCAVRSQPYLKDFSSSKGPGSGTIEVNPGGIMCPPFVVRYNTVSPSLTLKQAEHLNSIPTAVSGCRAACQTHLSAQHQELLSAGIASVTACVGHAQPCKQLGCRRDYWHALPCLTPAARDSKEWEHEYELTGAWVKQVALRASYKNRA